MIATTIGRESRFPIVKARDFWTGEMKSRAFPKTLKALSRVSKAWPKDRKIVAKIAGDRIEPVDGFSFTLDYLGVNQFEPIEGDAIEIDIPSILSATWKSKKGYYVSPRPGKKYKGNVRKISKTDALVWIDGDGVRPVWGTGKCLVFDAEPEGWRDLGLHRKNFDRARFVEFMERMGEIASASEEPFEVDPVQVLHYDETRAVEFRGVMTRVLADANYFDFLTKNYPGGAWTATGPRGLLRFFDAERALRAFVAPLDGSDCREPVAVIKMKGGK